MGGKNFISFIKKLCGVLVVILIISGSSTAYARAGGGGGSSGGGGGGTGGSHSSSRNSTGSRNPISAILSFGAFAIMASAGTIILRAQIGKKKVKSISVIKDLSKSDDNWNYKNIKREIEETFYKVQTAWMERDQDLAKEYMSEELYTKHRTQTEWMKIKKQKNILKGITLLGASPIGVEDHEGIDKDIIWVHIKAKSQDYIIDEETNEVIEGKARRYVQFEEYWKFIRKEQRWVLDEIRQIDEISDLNFFTIDVNNKDQ
ncbi:Tim44 domain-containing protein [Clostridium sp. YIM B02505]|uniref:Tim44 domain-containing protein n=1 Tax=Clostridium yunnanense TaxID=2800325 RepID=A0ABS1EK54_9CLOT|nr:Tim44-like domain-containing protein [Clostridium yunnanense]MBK1809741.1 Tim44 domain-containing protein [Clostridium yunnanense]